MVWRTRKALTEKTPAFECRAAKGRSCSAGRHPACFRGHSVKPSGPYPLGKNQSLSSPPLEPRGLLLSVMRQKVDKERIQGDCHPLGYPPLFSDRPRKPRPTVAVYLLADCLQRNFVLGRAPRRPLYAVAARRGRAMRSIATNSTPSSGLTPFSEQCRLEEAGGRRQSLLTLPQTAIEDRASRRHPTRREVPLGTRKLGLSLQSPLATTRW